MSITIKISYIILIISIIAAALFGYHSNIFNNFDIPGIPKQDPFDLAISLANDYHIKPIPLELAEKYGTGKISNVFGVYTDLISKPNIKSRYEKLRETLLKNKYIESSYNLSVLEKSALEMIIGEWSSYPNKDDHSKSTASIRTKDDYTYFLEANRYLTTKAGDFILSALDTDRGNHLPFFETPLIFLFNPKNDGIGLILEGKTAIDSPEPVAMEAALQLASTVYYNENDNVRDSDKITQELNLKKDGRYYLDTNDSPIKEVCIRRGELFYEHEQESKKTISNILKKTKECAIESAKNTGSWCNIFDELLCGESAFREKFFKLLADNKLNIPLNEMHHEFRGSGVASMISNSIKDQNIITAGYKRYLKVNPKFSVKDFEYAFFMLYEIDSKSLIGGYYAEPISNYGDEAKTTWHWLSSYSKEDTKFVCDSFQFQCNKDKKQWWIARSDLTECKISGGPAEKLDSFVGYTDRPKTKDYTDGSGKIYKVDVINDDSYWTYYTSKEVCEREQINATKSLADKYR